MRQLTPRPRRTTSRCRRLVDQTPARLAHGDPRGRAGDWTTVTVIQVPLVITPQSSRLAVLGRRSCAAAAVVSAVLHLAMLDGDLFASSILLIMVLFCAFCARDLWRGPSQRTWCLLAVMNLGMIGAHWSLPSCGHTAGAVSASSALMMIASGVAAMEAAVATIVLSVHARRLADHEFAPLSQVDRGGSHSPTAPTEIERTTSPTWTLA